MRNRDLNQHPTYANKNIHVKQISYGTIHEVGFPRWHGYTTFEHCELETELAQSANSVIKKT